MSWKDRIENIRFQITTGDGIIWTPKWFPRSKVIETNNTIYDYPKLQGSFVDRRQAKGDKYNFEIIFDGELCIDNSEQFISSAKDPRAWIVLHPYYGTLNVQPLRLNVDNSAYNVSKIQIEAVDTLLTQLQFSRQELRGELLGLKAELDTNVSVSYVAALNNPIASDATLMQDNVNVWDQIQSLAIKTKRELAEFKSLVNQTTQTASNLISDATAAILQFNTFLEYPFRVRDNLQGRFNTFIEQYERARATLSEFSGGTSATSARNKYFFTLQGASLISSACLVSVLEPDAEINEDDSTETLNYSIKDDYLTRSQITEQISRIKSFYAQFLSDSDALETERADKTNSYHLPNDVSFSLNQIVTETIRNLEGQIFGALQERSYELEKDSNIYLIAHRFLSSASDENVKKIIDINNIGLTEILGLNKGRKIIYYV